MKYCSFTNGPISARQVWCLEFNDQKMCPLNSPLRTRTNTVCTSAICANIYSPAMLSTEHGPHNNAITSHCLLNKLIFKHESRDCLVGILAIRKRRWPRLSLLFPVGRHSKTKRPRTCVYRGLNSLFSCTEHALHLRSVLQKHSV